MKTRILLLFTVLFTVMMSWATTPKEVEWSIIENPLTEGNLPMTASGRLIWGDYNNDGHLDAFIVAGQSADGLVAQLFKNNGNGTFTLIDTPDIWGFAWGSATFIDYDNDGDLDLIVCGSADATIPGALTLVYKNSGAPDYVFTEDETFTLAGVSPEDPNNGNHILEAFDYNNDGWMDLLVNGNAGGTWEVEAGGSGSSRVVAILKNNEGVLELQTNPVTEIVHFRPVNGGSIHTGDVNNDGYADIIVSGYHDVDKTVTDLYINNKNGTFTHWANSKNVFTGHMQGETVFVDTNADGWLDIVEVGRNLQGDQWINIANLFVNNQDNTFTKVGSEISNLVGGAPSVSAGDVNNDGLTDIFLAGWASDASVYYNNGENVFTRVRVPDITRARAGTANLVDFSGDDNLDYSIFGYRDGGTGAPGNPAWPHYFVKNILGEGIASNVAPSAPANFAASYADGKYTLTWNKSTDDKTPQNAIRYNVYVQYSDGKTYAYVPAHINTGKLKVGGGVLSFIASNSIELNLPKGDYTFGVQAVDQANATSAFTVISVTGTGVDEVSTLEGARAYASNNRINIVNNTSTDVSWSIINLAGQLVENGICPTSNKVEANSKLPAGVYLVKLSQGANIQTVKISIL
ncbi:MAG TPA: T9SS type A sorting domain-containing protein [Paludibacter sp.]|nr:MAG: FG-GAP repeat protein [Bacteroidetes bacterium ADurb.Bin174]HQB28368.1 T9SS type A sorting domain-containing protein [Paludibacter sp.]